MKTLVVATHKGGVGKTTSVVNLALYFYEQGLKVVVVDLDPQAHATHALQHYASGAFASTLISQVGASGLSAFDVTLGEQGEPCIALIGADGELADLDRAVEADAAGDNFTASVEALAEMGFDVCLIDTSPWLGQTMTTALYCADFVMSPFEPETFSILGISGMLEIIEKMKAVNPRLQNIGLLPMKVDRRNPRHVKHMDDLNEGHPDLIMPTAIGMRASIPEAIDEGVPVWRLRKTTARVAGREMKALAQYVIDKMELEA